MSALANLLGSLSAGVLIWLFATWIYELPRKRRETRDLLAVSYALIKREIDATSIYCKILQAAKTSQFSASGPITQAWETLHSTGVFRHFSPQLSEKLVKYYSLAFRLRANIELEWLLFVSKGNPVAGADPAATILQRLRELEIQVCIEMENVECHLRGELERGIAALRGRERSIFDRAYEKPPEHAELPKEAHG